jgi:hypothetical protein
MEYDFMTKNLIKLAMLGLMAGFCLSAAAAPKEENKEMAMSKCSKETAPDADKDGGGGCSGPKGCGSMSGSKEDQSDAQSNMSNKRKSAAHKVVYGP